MSCNFLIPSYLITLSRSAKLLATRFREADPNHVEETFSNADALKIDECSSIKTLLMFTLTVLSSVSWNQLNVSNRVISPLHLILKSPKCMRGLWLTLSHHCKVFWLPQAVLFGYDADGSLHAPKWFPNWPAKDHRTRNFHLINNQGMESTKEFRQRM